MKKRPFVKKLRPADYSSFLLGADIGATNTRLVIGGVYQGAIKPLLAYHYATAAITDFTKPLNEVLSLCAKQKTTPDAACFAVAGPVSTDRTRAKLTNGTFGLDTRRLLQETTLRSILLINDFEAVGYGINVLPPTSLYSPNKTQTPKEKATRCVIGAGTGLGKCILTYDPHLAIYTPHPSEGGHAELPVDNEREWQLLNYIKYDKGVTSHATWEDVLSGPGLTRLYRFLQTLKIHPATRYTKEVDRARDQAPLISKHRHKDALCKATFQLFAQFYARCAKNFALETLALGGVYIAGGIAAKNRDLFTDHHFAKEFEHHPTYAPLLRRIPLTIITTTDVSLQGALHAALRRPDLAHTR